MVFGMKVINKLLLNKLYGSLVELDKNRCKAIKEYCGKPCENSCPSGALSIKEGFINLNMCFCCGACTTACPIGAPVFTEYNDYALVEAVIETAKTSKYIRFLCNKSRNSYGDLGLKAIKVECLARIHAGILLSAAALDIDTMVLDTSWCDECQYNKENRLFSIIKGSIKDTLYWCKYVNKENVNIHWDYSCDKIIETEKITNANANFNSRDSIKRRDFFNYVNKELKVNSALIINEFIRLLYENIKIHDKKSNNMYLSLKQKITLLALNSLKKDYFLERELVGNYMPSIAQGCTLCSICNRSCPTNSLKQVIDNQTNIGTILYYPASCINCKICEKKCPEHVLKFKKTVTLRLFLNNEPQEIMKNTLAKCRQCKGLYISGQGVHGICEICYGKDKKRENIFL